jgi:mRNA interferase RelE/StbE
LANKPPRIDYKASVEGDLRRLDRGVASRIIGKIEKTLDWDSPPGKPLTGEFEGLFRLRVGDYRVIYLPTRDGYLILRIAHRKDAYR